MMVIGRAWEALKPSTKQTLKARRKVFRFQRCKIDGSVIGMRTRIRDGAVVEDYVVMGSDIYQVDDVQSRMAEHGNDIPFGIGEQSYIRKARIDKNARIGKNVRTSHASLNGSQSKSYFNEGSTRLDSSMHGEIKLNIRFASGLDTLINPTVYIKSAVAKSGPLPRDVM